MTESSDSVPIFDQRILVVGPFVIRLLTPIPAVKHSLSFHYRNHQNISARTDHFADFHICIEPVAGLRRIFRRQVQFKLDGKTPFKPLPYTQAFPFFEWGLNWCIANHHYQHLLLHAAVVEKNGKAIILPGQPGAGKSTLCAALVGHGWRLLSDEMAMLESHSNELIPIVRPISLKNESIPLIKKFVKDAEIGESFHDTVKGTVAHMKPPYESVLNGFARAKPRWIVFPQFRKNADINITAISSGQTVLDLAKNAFNYNVLGSHGFNKLCDLVQNCDCFQLEYSQLSDAIKFFSEKLQ